MDREDLVKATSSLQLHGRFFLEGGVLCTTGNFFKANFLITPFALEFPRKVFRVMASASVFDLIHLTNSVQKDLP